MPMYKLYVNNILTLHVNVVGGRNSPNRIVLCGKRRVQCDVSILRQTPLDEPFQLPYTGLWPSFCAANGAH